MTIALPPLVDQDTIQRDYRAELERFIVAFNSLQGSYVPLVFATAEDLAAGTSTNRALAPNVMRPALDALVTPGLTSRGAPDAGRAPRLNARGVLDLTFIEIPIATSQDIAAGTDNVKAVSPLGLAGVLSVALVQTGAVDAGRAPRLNSEGILDRSFLPINAETYRGTFDPTAAGGGQTPAVQDGNWSAGDFFVATQTGTYDFATGTPSVGGRAVNAGDRVQSNGTTWDILPGTAFVSLDMGTF